MNITIRTGHCLISFEPDEATVGRIIVPSARKSKFAFCHLHVPTVRWGEVDLTGRRIIVDRFSGRPFSLMHESVVHEFYICPQWAVMALIEESTHGS